MSLLLKNLPKISVIVPCYNQADYLHEAVESILDQNYSNWECIIINDGSPDSTSSVATELQKKDARILYFEKENGGLSSARNFGIEHATGTYILPLDADDKISSDYINECINSFLQDSSLSVVYCNAEFFGEISGKWNLPPFSLYQLALDNMIFCTAMFKKSEWSEAGGYDENMKNGMEDWEFWINLLKRGERKVLKLQFTGFYYRIKTKSMVETIDSNKKRMIYDYVFRKHLDFMLEHTGNPLQNLIERNLLKVRLEKINKNVFIVFAKKIKHLFFFQKLARIDRR
jgi:glycosyltransferase involved in cell wall biosynthesis